MNNSNLIQYGTAIYGSRDDLGKLRASLLEMGTFESWNLKCYMIGSIQIKETSFATYGIKTMHFTNNVQLSEQNYSEVLDACLQYFNQQP